MVDFILDVAELNMDKNVWNSPFGIRVGNETGIGKVESVNGKRSVVTALRFLSSAAIFACLSLFLLY